MKVLANSTKRSKVFVIFAKTKIFKKTSFIFTYYSYLKQISKNSLYIYLEKVLHTVDS